MSLHRTKLFLLLVVLLLSACGKQAQTVQSTATFPPPTETTIPSTETPTEISAATFTPSPTQDPALFGVILQTEIQAFSLEPVADAIFSKVMDGFIANGNIIEYQVIRVTIFPSSDGTLLSEITYNVRTTEPYWLADGGMQASDDWINDKCNRFDFVTTETEFQLKNRRTCN